MQISLITRALCANNCGRRLRQNYRYYCSNACKNTAYRKWLIDEWVAGTLRPAPCFNRVLRRHILELLGERCQRCGWNERNPASGKIPIEIEHIDGDWENIAPENITLLCPNCHSLTSTFRGLNRGRGRPGRPGTLASGERVRASLEYPLRPAVTDSSTGNTSTAQVSASFAGSLFG